MSTEWGTQCSECAALQANVLSIEHPKRIAVLIFGEAFRAANPKPGCRSTCSLESLYYQKLVVVEHFLLFQKLQSWGYIVDVFAVIGTCTHTGVDALHGAKLLSQW